MTRRPERRKKKGRKNEGNGKRWIPQKEEEHGERGQHFFGGGKKLKVARYH